MNILIVALLCILISNTSKDKAVQIHWKRLGSWAIWTFIIGGAIQILILLFKVIKGGGL